MFSPATYGPIPVATVNFNPISLSMKNHTTSDPVPIPHQHGSNHEPAAEMTIMDESSASSTPVSDTTATDTDSTNVSNVPP